MMGRKLYTKEQSAKRTKRYWMEDFDKLITPQAGALPI